MKTCLFPNVKRFALLAGVSLSSIGFALCLPSLSYSQDKPDRPPWAQPGTSQPQVQPPPPSEPIGAPPDVLQPVQAPPPPQERQESPASRNTIKVHVNLVSVLVSVLDDKNRPAPNLPVEAFQVFEGGVQQRIDIFESETKQPLDLALMVDASLSAHKEIVFEREAASHFIKQILRPDDRMGVFYFDEQVTQIASFSDNVATLQDAVRKIPDGAGTSIYDAVLLGSKALEKRGSDRRRVIIMITDAGETTSRADFESARKAAVRAGILLYTIVIRPVKNENGRNTAGEHALQNITEMTGGAMFYPDSATELAAIFDQIDRELRTQYRLAYYPNPRGTANSYRTIEVKVLPGYTARHRTMYLSGPQ